MGRGRPRGGAAGRPAGAVRPLQHSPGQLARRRSGQGRLMAGGFTISRWGGGKAGRPGTGPCPSDRQRRSAATTLYGNDESIINNQAYSKARPFGSSRTDRPPGCPGRALCRQRPHPSVPPIAGRSGYGVSHRGHGSLPRRPPPDNHQTQPPNPTNPPPNPITPTPFPMPYPVPDPGRPRPDRAFIAPPRRAPGSTGSRRVVLEAPNARRIPPYSDAVAGGMAPISMRLYVASFTRL